MKRVMGLMLALGMVLSLTVPSAGAAELQDSGLLWLVNYDHSASADYVPSDMQVTGNGSKLRAAAAQAYETMIADLNAAGHRVVLVSGYRAYSVQTNLFNARLAKRQNQGMGYQQAYDATRRYTAVPGTSEHQLGLAVDLSTTGTLSSRFGESGPGAWIQENCWKYGFILRYREEKSAYTQIADEAWHFRYVGMPHAQIITERDWCLEEYISYLQEHGGISVDAGDEMLYEIVWSAAYPASREGVIDLSSDNAGGYITTSYHSKDPLINVTGHWAEGALRHLFALKEMPWMGAIDPTDELTRGEFAQLCAQLTLPEGKGVETAFSDVGEDSLYGEAVQVLCRAGMVNTQGGRFYPDAKLSREEAAAIIARTLEGQEMSWLDYADVGEISGWAFQAVQQVSHCGLMGGQDGLFRPKAPVTWGEAAALLCKLEGYLMEPAAHELTAAE